MVKNKKWGRLGVLSAVSVLILSFAFFGGGTFTYALDADPGTPVPATNPTPAENPDTADDSDTGTTCAIEKMGWILCPVIETAGKMGDQAFQFLSKTFLETEPELISNDDNGTRKAWELARNIANIMFIIGFLFIIYSQVTGAGINNYGIKKMLPRLIVAALAVNLSYYICQLAVDFTNVLGYESQNFLVNVAKEVSQYSALPPAGSLVFGDKSPGTLETIIAAILGVAAIVWFLLPFLFLGITTIVITCLIIIVILLLRKAFIVILIVAAPIAFVLYLLPNTERYFKQWASMFWKLLLVFPIIGVLMGGGQLASAIVLTAGSNGADSIYADGDGKCIQLPKYGASGGSDPSGEVRTGPCGDNSTPFMLGLIAATIAVAPLLAVGAVLKTALAGAGVLGGKISGAVQTYSQKGGEGAEKRYKESAFGQMRAREKKLREIDIKAGNYNGRNPYRIGRNKLNEALNATKNANENIPFIKKYGDQRGRIMSKEDNEYIRDKAQEFAADNTAGNDSKIEELLLKMQDKARDSNGNIIEKKFSDSDKSDAISRLKAHRLAVGQTQGKAGVDAFDEKMHDVATSKALETKFAPGHAYASSISQAYQASQKHDTRQRDLQSQSLASALAPHLSTINPQAQQNAAGRQQFNNPTGSTGRVGGPPAARPVNPPNQQGGGGQQNPPGGNNPNPPSTP